MKLLAEIMVNYSLARQEVIKAKLPSILSGSASFTLNSFSSLNGVSMGIIVAWVAPDNSLFNMRKHGP